MAPGTQVLVINEPPGYLIVVFLKKNVTDDRLIENYSINRAQDTYNTRI